MNKAVEIIRKHTMLIVLVLVFIFFTIITKGQMFSASSFDSLIKQNAYVYVLAAGMLMCMLTGGNIDLSVGSVVCFIGAIGGIMMVNNGVPIWISMITMMVVGLIIGCLQGYLIAYLNIPPWISTLAGMLAFRGWGTALMKGLTIAPMPDNFVKIFSGYVPGFIGGGVVTCLVFGVIVCAAFIILEFRSRNAKVKKGYEVATMQSTIVKCVLVAAVTMLFAYKLGANRGIPFSLIWVAVILLIYNFITSKTTIGRYFYMIGDNVEATRLSGINTKKIFFIAYLNMAFLTVISAWMTMAKLTAANPTAGTNYEMDAISACIVGGVSAYGGSGSVFGMVVGATLIGVINLGMSLMGLDANLQKVVKGVVLLAAVVFEILNNKDKAAK